MISRIFRGFALVFLMLNGASPLCAQNVTADYFIGRWGQVSYNREEDLPRMAKMARDYCGDVATVINRRSSETFMMYVTTDLKEVQLFEQGGRTYIVPVDQLGGEGPINGARELQVLGPNAFTLRYLEDEANRRYGPNVFVRCNARKEPKQEKQLEQDRFTQDNEAMQDEAADKPKLRKMHRKHRRSESDDVKKEQQ